MYINTTTIIKGLATLGIGAGAGYLFSKKESKKQEAKIKALEAKLEAEHTEVEDLAKKAVDDHVSELVRKSVKDQVATYISDKTIKDAIESKAESFIEKRGSSIAEASMYSIAKRSIESEVKANSEKRINEALSSIDIRGIFNSEVKDATAEYMRKHKYDVDEALKKEIKREVSAKVGDIGDALTTVSVLKSFVQ